MKNIAVLRGGPSNEYEVSMKTGSNVLKVLRDLNYKHKDVVITKNGDWLENGFIKTSNATLEGVDVVFLALHGTYGEDGQIQRILENAKIPFTGSRALSSAIAFNKELTKNVLLQRDLKMPKHKRFEKSDLKNIDKEIENIFTDIGTELFVKPLTSGSSLGAYYVPNKETLKKVLTELLQVYEKVLIEEFIRGKEATVAVLENFRNEKVYTLPVIEIVPPNGEPLFSNESKYNGTTKEIVPGRFSYHEKSLLSEAARMVHEVIDCKLYSRSDFLVKDGEIYFLEVNTLPGLTSESLFPKAAEAVGLSYKELIKHLIENAS